MIMIKKIRLFLFLTAAPFSLFAQSTHSGEGVVSIRNSDENLPAVTERSASDSVPSLLQGIWQGKDRLIMFSNENEFALVLRVFYQWYNDRAAEPASFAEIKTRDRNDATISPSQEITVRYIMVAENPSKTSGVYELEVKFPDEKEPVFIPVCVIDQKLYLDFLIKDSASVTDLRFSSQMPETAADNPAISESVGGDFFRAASNASGITISSPVFAKEVVSYFFADNGKEIYRIRYWLSEMDYSYAKATFSDGDKVFSVDKYLRIGSNVYQCTTGKSSKIRNIQKSSELEKTASYDSDGGIIAFGEPYLIKVPDENERGSAITSAAFLNSVEEMNKRRKPAPKPLFPPTFPKYHWKEITEMELYNPSTWNKRNLDIHK